MKNNRKRFVKDMDTLLEKMRPGTSTTSMDQLHQVRDRLVELSQKRLVKINHSIMQFLVAKHLIENGFRVEIEYLINGGKLVADIFAVRKKMIQTDDARDVLLSEMHGTSEDEETLVVEVETGFVPPKAALNPGRYRLIRIASKIARYAGFSHYFSLATPHYHVLQIPDVMFQRVGHRDEDELLNLKALCDSQYISPPIMYEELATCEIHRIYVVNVDGTKVLETDPQKYRYTVIQAEEIIQR
jgi:hypothetical protein